MPAFPGETLQGISFTDTAAQCDGPGSENTSKDARQLASNKAEYICDGGKRVKYLACATVRPKRQHLENYEARVIHIQER